MENKRVRRAQLRTLTCPGCGERGLLKTILWGMPEATFDYNKYASGGCIVPHQCLLIAAALDAIRITTEMLSLDSLITMKS